MEVEKEERFQPDTIPSSIPIRAAAEAAAAVPSPVSSSTVAAADPRAGLTNPAPAGAPVAFVEKDLVVNQEPEEEARREPQPETITSGDTTSTCTGAHAPLQQPTTRTDHEDNKTNTINNGVMIKSEDSLADTNNNQKRKQGSTIPIKSEELNKDDDSYSTNMTRRGKRKRHPSEKDYIESSDNLNANTTKNRRVGGHTGGGRRSATNNIASKRISLRNKHHQEEDNAQDETKCCQFCNDPSLENRIYYKCGTVLSKYFPKSNNNPNPGWYKGAIWMHHVASSNSSFDSDYDYEYEEGALNSSSEEGSEEQCIIYNEIHYEDGDVENITQDDLKLQMTNGDWVKILLATKKPTTSNADVAVATSTLSDNKRDQNWLEIFRRLRKFKDENGHCRVPKNYGPDPPLGRWVQRQRIANKKGNLADDRVEKLNKIGFDWDTFDQTWDEMFGRLENFKTENSHCRVPQKYDPDPSLGLWVSNQRKIYKKGTLAHDRAEKLEEIGFEWDTYAEIWNEMFGRLEQFKAENGHCRVLQRYDPDPPLGIWVSNQRMAYKKGKMANDRIEKLEEIDFEWDPLIC